MTILRALPLAIALAAAAAITPASAPDAQAQVSNIDAAWASSAIMNAGRRAGQIPSIKKVPSVGVIRLDIPTVPMLMGDIPTWQEYKIMAQRNAAGIAKLQRALNANPATRAALAKARIATWQVAGVQIGSNGALRFYIFTDRYW